MVLQLGIFSVSDGFLYNDFFSIGVQLFELRWKEDAGNPNLYTSDYDITNSGGRGPYPFGLDRAWYGATDELLLSTR